MTSIYYYIILSSWLPEKGMHTSSTFDGNAIARGVHCGIIGKYKISFCAGHKETLSETYHC